jgi:hypothetical protein
METPHPFSEFTAALKGYQARKAALEDSKRDPHAQPGTATWEERDRGRRMAAEGLWVSGMAVLLDALDRYCEAAARDREAQALAREAREKEMRELAKRDDRHMAVQRRQGWITLGFTVVIAISTAIYTVAAWKQAQQSARTVTPSAVSPK